MHLHLHLLLLALLYPFTRTDAIRDLVSIDDPDVRKYFELAVRLHNSDPGARFQIDPRIGIATPENAHQFHRIVCRQFSRRVYAVIGAVSYSSNLLRSYANAFQIPFVSASSFVPSVDFVLNIRPSHPPRALLDVLACFKRTNTLFATNTIRKNADDLTYLYDDDEGRGLLLDLMRTNATFKFRLMRRISAPSDAAEPLMQLQTEPSAATHYVILDCDHRLARRVVYAHSARTATATAKGKPNIHFLILNDDEDDESQWDSVRGVAVTRFQNRNGTSNSSLAAALVFDAVKILALSFSRLRAKKDDAFAFQNDSMRCDEQNRTSPWPYGSKMMRVVLKVATSGLTGAISFDQCGNRKTPTVNVLETRGDGEAVRVRQWSEKTGIDTCQSDRPDEKKDKDKDKDKDKYIVTTILDEPYLMWRNGKFEGYCADLADEIAQQINITYEFKLVNDSHYGGPDPNSSYGWDGMIGELLSGEADLAIAPLTITSARERVIAFTKPFMTLGISVMMEKPRGQQKNDFSFVKPLSMEIWMCVAFAYVGVSTVLVFVTRFSSRRECTLTVQDILWLAFAALVHQGGETLPRCVAGRIVASVWWFFSLIVVTSYTANLAAFLTVERMVTTINSAQDLAKQTRVEYGILAQGSTQEFFKNSQNPTYQRMWEFMNARKHHVFVRSNDQGADRVRNSGGTFAFLMESVKNDYMNQRRPCNTIKVGPNLDTKGYGVATSQHSPLRQRLNIAILCLTENGDLGRLYTKWWRNTGECAFANKEFNDSELTLTNVAGVFYILSAGLVLAITTALCTIFL